MSVATHFLTKKSQHLDGNPIPIKCPIRSWLEKKKELNIITSFHETHKCSQNPISSYNDMGILLQTQIVRQFPLKASKTHNQMEHAIMTIHETSKLCHHIS